MRLDIIGSRTCPPVDIMLYLKHLPTAIISGGARVLIPMLGILRF